MEIIQKAKGGVKMCPKCGSASLKYVDGALVCGECGFQQNLKQIKEG